MASSKASDPHIAVPILLWARLIAKLQASGRGVRESGAFLLGQRRGCVARISEFVCFDTLDPDAYQNGVIIFHASGYAALWKHCRERKLEAICDVHTHPFADVRQSPIDEGHPMIPTLGHTAMVVPHFANTPWWSLKRTGIYEYLGDSGWRSYPPPLPKRRVRLSLW